MTYHNKESCFGDADACLSLAAKKLMSGDVVGIPTETVYGLAACINSENGIKRIFEIKERPFFDPLIVHVHSIQQAISLSGKWGQAHQLIAEKYWPGPVTLIVEKKEVSDLITSGLSTVGVRCPNHPLTLRLIELVKVPLAAPSANKFGKTSPTEAKHVSEAFGADVFVIDGGPCQIGIESTILEIKEHSDEIEIIFLRSGLLTKEEIRKTLEPLKKKIRFSNPGRNISAPGQVEHHYMPPVPIILTDQATSLGEVSLKYKFKKTKELILSDEPELAARELYGKMRSIAESSDSIVFFKKSFHNHEIWMGIMDRLYRAATYRDLNGI